jgi:hypothetical protein
VLRCVDSGRGLLGSCLGLIKEVVRYSMIEVVMFGDGMSVTMEVVSVSLWRWGEGVI